MPIVRIAVVGGGRVGTVVAWDLARTLEDVEVVVGTRNLERTRERLLQLGAKSVEVKRVDAADRSGLESFLRGFELAVGALPGRLGFRFLEACIAQGVDAVDVSYMPENPFDLNERAVDATVQIIPDAGIAPGVSNLLVGYAMGLLRVSEVDEVRILVGGIPEKPIGPLGYVVTWSVDDLIDEYLRPARIVENGQVVEVEALSGLERVEVPGIGDLEAFYTDGLRTLLVTVKAKRMYEKTLRWPGHAQAVKLLRDLGFFEPDVRSTTAKVLERRLRKEGVPDLVVLLVSVRAAATEKGFRVVVRYDAERRLTAMAQATGFATAGFAWLVARRRLKPLGVIPPEYIGMRTCVAEEFLDYLMKRGFSVRKLEPKGEIRY